MLNYVYNLALYELPIIKFIPEENQYYTFSNLKKTKKNLIKDNIMKIIYAIFITIIPMIIYDFFSGNPKVRIISPIIDEYDRLTFRSKLKSGNSTELNAFIIKVNEIDTIYNPQFTMGYIEKRGRNYCYIQKNPIHIII